MVVIVLCDVFCGYFVFMFEVMYLYIFALSFVLGHVCSSKRLEEIIALNAYCSTLECILPWTLRFYSYCLLFYTPHHIGGSQANIIAIDLTPQPTYNPTILPSMAPITPQPTNPLPPGVPSNGPTTMPSTISQAQYVFSVIQVSGRMSLLCCVIYDVVEMMQ